MLKSNHLLLYGLIAVCAVIEIALSLSDIGVVGTNRTRRLFYDYGAFWPGLLGNWKPNFAAQPFAMFVTYGFLHSGLVHLAVNIITLWSLGRAVLERVGQGSFAILYALSSLGGGLGFALLAPGLRPMVGASGALFGLLGAILAWEYVDDQSDSHDRWRVAWVVLILAALNFLLWWAMSGQLAWEGHLGGFVVGWIGGLLIKRAPLSR